MILKPRLFRKLRYGPHWSKTGLVGLWLMNEGDGNIIGDLSGNGITGTFGNTTSWLTGDQGPAIDFTSANDDYIGCGNPTILQSLPQVSVVCRFNPDAVGGNDTLVSKNPGSGSQGFFLYNFGVNNLVYAIGTGSLTRGASLPTQPTIGDWHTAVGVYNGVNIVLYLDTIGNKSTPVAKTGTVANTANNLVFGMFGDLTGTTEYDGQIEFVYIYNRVLSASEIQQLFINPYIMFDRDKIELWSAATQGVVAGANPKGPLGHPSHGALAGPISF